MGDVKLCFHYLIHSMDGSFFTGEKLVFKHQLARNPKSFIKNSYRYSQLRTITIHFINSRNHKDNNDYQTKETEGEMERDRVALFTS